MIVANVCLTGVLRVLHDGLLVPLRARLLSLRLDPLRLLVLALVLCRLRHGVGASLPRPLHLQRHFLRTRWIHHLLACW